MKRNNKKGFTIVELVIVIAVVAILAAVLIPTFSNIIKKANRSADQQAVRQMNTVLAAEGAVDELDIYDVFDILAEAGMNAKNYKALSANTTFFWDKDLNRVLMVENDVVVYPEEYKEVAYTDGKWSSLSQTIVAEKVEVTDKAATVENANQLVYALERAEKGDVNEIALDGGTVDMMGSALTVDVVAKNKTLEISGGTVKNATAIEAKTTFASTNVGNDGIYNMGFVTKVESGATLHIKDLVLDNAKMKDTNAGNCGFLVGTLSGKLILENVTIKNSSIVGYTSVGALVGYISGGSIEIRGNLTIENVSVQGVGGRIGQLIGYSTVASEKIALAAGANVVITNVTNTIYECEQNTGACVVSGCTHGALGLDGDIIHSWQIDGSDGLNCEKKGNRVFYADSLVGLATTSATADYNTAVKAILGLS